MKLTRLKPEERKAQAVRAGLELADQRCYPLVTISAVAKRLGLNPSALTYHFKSADLFRDAIVKEAIEQRRWRVAGQAVMLKHPAVAGKSKQWKARALEAL